MPIKCDHQFNTSAGPLWAILGAPTGLTGFPAQLVVRLMALRAPFICRAQVTSRNGSSATITKLDAPNMPALWPLGHHRSAITRACAKSMKANAVG
ncbi:MAG: hypothetical protein OSB34_08185 [Planktomarina sp.]|nr:hypothetical protein [Planktomarina sp.]